MRKRDAIVVFCAALALAALPAAGQSPEKPESSSQSPQPAASQGKPAPPPAAKPKGAEATLPADPEAAGKTVEEIIARVNNEIITLSEYEKARQTAEEDAKQECQGHCTPEQLQADIGDRRKNALRELIDQSLLVQRGKDMGLNVEADVIKQLDQIRIQNKLDRLQEQYPQPHPHAESHQQRSWVAHQYWRRRGQEVLRSAQIRTCATGSGGAPRERGQHAGKEPR